MPQYIHDNTEDEISHFTFINAYLSAKGSTAVNDQFRTLPSSKATGARPIGRLTNLMQLSVDTSWWTGYRSRNNNPDLDLGFAFDGPRQVAFSPEAGQFELVEMMCSPSELAEYNRRHGSRGTITKK
jgi:hypothetical protein